MNAQGNTRIGPVLLLGGSGMLGRAWRELLTSQHVEFFAPTHAEFDPTKEDHLDSWLPYFTGQTPLPIAGLTPVPPGLKPSIRFSLMVNCAAWTDVDGAEQHPAEAAALNTDVSGALAVLCAHIGATFIHYSTDYVFDGRATRPYPTDAPRNPQNVYGKTKAEGELYIESSGCKFLIIRTSWLYASWGKNFVRTILRAAGRNPDLRVVSDQRGRPTACRHLATASLDLLHAHASGIHHVTDGGECTWFDFAREIIRLAHLPCKVLPCTTADFPRPAKRPAYSVMDLSRTEKIIGPMPDWKANLAHVMAHMEPL